MEKIFNTPIGIIKKTEARSKEIIDISNKVAKHYTKETKFDLCFYDFSQTLSSGINSEVPLNKKEKRKLNRKELNYLKKIKLIANKNVNELTLKEKSSYLKSLEGFSEKLKKVFHKNNIEFVIVPFRGGNILTEFLNIDKEKIIPIDCKRVMLKEKNSMGIGMSIKMFSFRKTNWYKKMILSLEDKEIAFLEISIASGLTTLAFIFELLSKKIKPKKIYIVSPFVSLVGKSIINQISKHYNLNIVIASRLNISRLGNYWKETEDSILDEEGKFIIGKATEILKDFIKVEKFK